MRVKIEGFEIERRIHHYANIKRILKVLCYNASEQSRLRTNKEWAGQPQDRRCWYYDIEYVDLYLYVNRVVINVRESAKLRHDGAYTANKLYIKTCVDGAINFMIISRNYKIVVHEIITKKKSKNIRVIL